MQYELLAHRGMQPNDEISSMFLLYSYSKYKKEREEAAQALANAPRPRARRT